MALVGLPEYESAIGREFNFGWWPFSFFVPPTSAQVRDLCFCGTAESQFSPERVDVDLIERANNGII